MSIERNSHVFVQFENEGEVFNGHAVVDRVEDGRIYGRMKDGRTFMCEFSDVEPVSEVNHLHGEYQQWVCKQGFYEDLFKLYGRFIFNRDGDSYRNLHVRIGFTAFVKDHIGNI